MINENGCRLHENGDQCHGGGRCTNAMRAGVMAQEDDHCRNINEVFGDNDRRAHVHFEKWVFDASRCVQREPRGVDQRASVIGGQHTLDRVGRIGLHFASCPTMVSCEGGIVQAPILQVIKVPKGHRKMISDLHPMPLGFKVAVHRLFPQA
jgi:hypothetical protein